MKQAKIFHQLNYALGFEDIYTEDWNVFIKKHGEGYFLQMETGDEVCPKLLLKENEMENIAVFCRGFLSAWQFSQSQEKK